MSHKALVRQAAVSHFQSKVEEAKIRMRVYEEPVGVGEHPYVLAEYLKAVEDYEHAESCVEIVQALG
tara:strand:- start:1130 stop:1330 length:201 start_codon:yes stop_codon:yes gene_type:complete